MGRASAAAATRRVSAVARRAGRGFRTAVVNGRWFVVSLWLAGAVFAVINPVPTESTKLGELEGLLPEGSQAVEVQNRSLDLFRVPVLSDTTVVVHDPGGLSLLTRADVALRAAAQTQAYLRGDIPRGRGQVIGAVPVPTRTGETAVTYLYISPGTTLTQSTALGRQYAAHFDSLPGVTTYVTGALPARVQQVYHLQQRLHVFELATLVLITVVVALTFRSVMAPIVVLLTAGLGYFVANWVLGQLAARVGIAVPEQLQPLIAALLIGVVTDYCVLFFSGFRAQLGRGHDSLEAARRAVLTEGPIVAVAGATVAAGTAALLAANFDLFRAFGPALALTVLIGMLVSLTLVPALMAILGHRLFRPVGAARPPQQRGPSRFTLRLGREVAGRRGAVWALAVSLALLVPMSLPLLGLRIDVSFISELPDDDPVLRGAEVLDESGVRGVVAPTEVLVEGDGVAQQRAALARLGTLLEREPGVAEVIGPGSSPFDDRFGIVLARNGDAARFVTILDSDPLGARAIEDFLRLQDRLEVLADEAGLGGVRVAATGQTAIAAELADITRENLWITLIAVLAVEFVLLALYLRALITPLLLLASSAMGVAAALGMTVLLFQGVMGDAGLAFYAPFTTAVLLLALGADYNVFAVGSIWEEARRRPMSRAIAVAMPATAKAISVAGVILAATFAMVAIIPLGTFRQIAFTIALGLLIDTFLIRPVLTPALLTLLGRYAGWPSKRITTRSDPVTEEEQTRLLSGREDEHHAGAEGPVEERRAVAVPAGGRAP